jgi:hypothetical protein
VNTHALVSRTLTARPNISRVFNACYPSSATIWLTQSIHSFLCKRFVSTSNRLVSRARVPSHSSARRRTDRSAPTRRDGARSPPESRPRARATSTAQMRLFDGSPSAQHVVSRELVVMLDAPRAGVPRRVRERFESASETRTSSDDKRRAMPNERDVEVGWRRSTI